LKILVIVNNHNSIGVVDFCIDLKKLEPQVEVMVVCDSKIESTNAEFFDDKGVSREVFKLDNNKQSSVLAGAKELERQSKVYAINKQSLKSKLISLMLFSSLYSLAREIFIFSRLKKYKAYALELLKKLRPDIVLSLSDRSHDYIESSVLWSARKIGIKVVLPYIAQYDVDAALQYRVDSEGSPLPELRPFWPFSVYKLLSYLSLKEQIYKGFFFQSPYILNANKRSGTLSDYPWWVGNGISDIVCVDSEYTARKYVSYKVKKDKINVVGHVSYDKVFRSACNREAIRKSLFDEYSLEKEKKLIVLSMPQYAEQGYMSWSEHWAEINLVMKEVDLFNANLLVSIHPRSDVNDYLFIQDRYNCKIIRESLSDVIGAADLFMASNSTTFVWAVLSGVPSIALMSPVPFLYAHLKSVYLIDSNFNLLELIDYVLNLSTDIFEQDWELLSKDVVFDGRFNVRFLQLLHDASVYKT